MTTFNATAKYASTYAIYNQTRRLVATEILDNQQTPSEAISCIIAENTTMIQSSKEFAAKFYTALLHLANNIKTNTVMRRALTTEAERMCAIASQKTLNNIQCFKLKRYTYTPTHSMQDVYESVLEQYETAIDEEQKTPRQALHAIEQHVQTITETDSNNELYRATCMLALVFVKQLGLNYLQPYMQKHTATYPIATIYAKIETHVYFSKITHIKVVECEDEY